TYAVVAFRQAQGQYIPMAHHLHVEAQILRGVSLGIPVVVLIRNPVDAVRSLIIRHPTVDPDSEFQRYIDFYSAVERVVDKVVVADFATVTEDFGSVISRINDKYGTTYKIFKSTPENIKLVYKEIEEINKEVDGGKESHVARPSKERKQKEVSISISDNYKKAVSIYSGLIQRSL
ncbi:MAG TPA: hypothetical protein VKA08_08020, partial [Balneolales bacterium]|nr:hypothetical protein [Balneolales bacterium]